MTPELLQTLTAAKGLPMPEESAVTVDSLALLFKREKRLRDMAERLHAEGLLPSGSEKAFAEYFGNTVTGKQSQSMKAPEWTVAECALACQGLDRKFFFAMRYTYALDDSVFYSLATYLWHWALERREQERWPHRVTTLAGLETQYMQTLVDLWLMEVRKPWRFIRRPNDPDLRRVVMNVSEPVWRRRLSPIYEAIGEEFVCWLAIGASHMRYRLRESEVA